MITKLADIPLFDLAKYAETRTHRRLREPRKADEPSERRNRRKKTMKIHSKDFRIREGDDVDLGKRPTKVDPVYKSKEQHQKLLEEHVAQLSAIQHLHYASNRYALLLIFQAMDAAGKTALSGT
jgi:polyphosphate kinase 2 (PPK2 family)